MMTFRAPGTFSDICQNLNIEILEGSMIESCQNLNIGRTSILRSTKFSISKYLVPANLNLGSKLRFNLNLEIGMFKNSKVSYYNDNASCTRYILRILKCTGVPRNTESRDLGWSSSHPER